MARLVEAHNHCWLPHHPGEPPLTLPEFKGLVRERNLWCSSCLIALEGDEPIGFLHGCKREKETLLHRFAVHPAHLRGGHGRHLLTSISSKLAILGPPRMVAEIPEEAASALGLLRACGYAQEETLVDWRREAAPPPPEPEEIPGSLFIPVTAAELQANRLLEGGSPAPAWERAAPSLLALGDRLLGTALVLEERIAASILYVSPGEEGQEGRGSQGRLLYLGGSREAGGLAHLDRLVSRLLRTHSGPWLCPRALPDDPAVETLRAHGFEAADRFLRMAAVARPA